MTLGFCSSFHFSVWVTLFLSDLCHMIFSIFPATHSSKWPFDSGCILYLPQLNVFILYKYYWLNFSTCNVMSYRPLVHRLLYISCKLVLGWMFVWTGPTSIFFSSVCLCLCLCRPNYLSNSIHDSVVPREKQYEDVKSGREVCEGSAGNVWGQCEVKSNWISVITVALLQYICSPKGHD